MHIAKKMFDYCFAEGDIQRLRPASLRNLAPLFDDFESMFFSQMARIIHNNLEFFGFTNSVVFNPRMIYIAMGPDYEDLRKTGIIASNEIPNAMSAFFLLQSRTI